MDAVEELRSRIVASSTVTSLIGENVYEQRVPEQAGNQSKYVLLQRLYTGIDEHLDGPSGLERTPIQVSCFGKDLDVCKAIRAAVRAAATGSDDDDFKSRVDDVRDFYEDDTRLFNLQFDLVIQFRT